MSTDLQFRQEVLGIRCPSMTIKVNLSSSSSPAAAAAASSSSEVAANCGAIQSPDSAMGGGKGAELADCRTPESPRNMIPKAQNCPPAPKKPAPARAPSCKRKLCEFFEIVAREEIQSFFRQIEVKPDNIKKRCIV